MAYPGYGAPAPGGAPGQYPQAGYPGGPPTTDPLYGYFTAVAGQDQQIDSTELGRCLTSSGIAGTYQQFDEDTCRLMINMLDKDYSGKMGFTEFKELWGALNQWKTCFEQYDRDRSGTLEPHEIQQAWSQMGYNLTPNLSNIMIKKYSTDSRIRFDRFIHACVSLKMKTDYFRRHDTTQTGHANMSYDTFMQIAMM